MSSDHYFALPVGARLHEFEIRSVLGSGGFGITYCAIDTLLDEPVALKEYLPNELAIRTSESTVRAKTEGERSEFEAGLKAYLGEARLMARFRHKNLVHVRRFFEFHGTGCIVQDYERGVTLNERLAQGPMDEASLHSLLGEVLNGLEVLHDRATLHRDLKPSNIILREDGTLVLIDFGAPRDFGSRHSRSITAIATAGFSPPEQYEGGEQGPWTDFYALGAIAYRAVTGATPLDSLRRLRKDTLVPAATAAAGKYTVELLQTIDWMMRIDEAERPRSAGAIRERLLKGGNATATIGPPKIDKVRIASISSGRVDLIFVEPPSADVLELSFFATPPGKYLAPHADRAVWSDRPHYFSVYKTSDKSAHFLCEAESAINAIASGAQVKIASQDGFIAATTSWPQITPIAASPKQSHKQLAAVLGALALLIAAGIGFYFFQQQRSHDDLNSRLITAQYNPDALNGLLRECGAAPPR